ncbi:hypothetical protein MUP00_12675 [Candidatus Bathyarchaeota archaeon]|nr:hypothetical protein [Candidatus Bathyarchaeota archaeon]
MFIDYVVELLGDGKWHYTRGLARKLDQSEDRIRMVLKFLADFDFAALDETRNRCKLCENLRKLLAPTGVVFAQDPQ